MLAPYEKFIKERPERYLETSMAQMHDWLKELYPDFSKTSQKTVFNFVDWIRGKHNIPRIKPQREYYPVEELPYGKQAQVDFGQYNMLSSTGKRVKVYFFTLILSRSWYKFIWFKDRDFTSELAIKAHELSFEYIKGILMRFYMTRTKFLLLVKMEVISFLQMLLNIISEKRPLCYTFAVKLILKAKAKWKM